jgi:alpha-glucosidase
VDARRCVTNFGPGPVPLPNGSLILTSAPVEGDQLPADTTAWLLSS